MTLPLDLFCNALTFSRHNRWYSGRRFTISHKLLSCCRNYPRCWDTFSSCHFLHDGPCTTSAGGEKPGLTLCRHVSPVPSVLYSTVLCAESVTHTDKENPSRRPFPAHYTTGNYHQYHPISAVFKWGKLICRLGVVPVLHHAHRD